MCAFMSKLAAISFRNNHFAYFCAEMPRRNLLTDSLSLTGINIYSYTFLYLVYTHRLTWFVYICPPEMTGCLHVLHK